MKPCTAILYAPDSKGCRWVENEALEAERLAELDEQERVA